MMELAPPAILPSNGTLTLSTAHTLDTHSEQALNFRPNMPMGGCQPYIPSAKQQAETEELLREIYQLNPTCTNVMLDARLNKEAAWTQSIFMKLPGYRNYREKQPGKAVGVVHKGKKKQEMDWPIHMEFAFFKAMVLFPPQGRKQWKYPKRYANLPLDDPVVKEPLKGRNELFAIVIAKWTGQHIDRKHISSHIQVLRGYVISSEGVPESFQQAMLLKYFGRQTEKKSHMGLPGTIPRSVSSGRERSRYIERPITPLASRQLPLPSLGSPFNMDHGHVFNKPKHSFEPHGFEMFVKDETGEVISRLTRLRIPMSRLSNLPAPSANDLFPAISTIFNEENGTCNFDSELILANATMSISEASLEGVELGIDFSIRSYADLARYASFQCRTRFFVKSQDNACLRHFHHAHVTKEIEYDRHNSMLRAIPFGSKFWAACAKGFATKLGEANRHRAKANLASDAKDAAATTIAAQKLQAEVKSSIGGLTAVQEIFAAESGRTNTRLLVIYWEFEQAAKGEPGETTWRHISVNEDAELLVPPSPRQAPVKSVSASFPGASAPSSSLQKYPPFGSLYTGVFSGFMGAPEQQSYSFDAAQQASSWPPASSSHGYGHGNVMAGAAMPAQPGLLQPSMPDYHFQITLDTRTQSYYEGSPSATIGAESMSPATGHMFDGGWPCRNLTSTHGMANSYFDSHESPDMPGTMGMIGIPTGIEIADEFGVDAPHRTTEDSRMMNSVHSPDSPDAEGMYTPSDVYTPIDPSPMAGSPQHIVRPQVIHSHTQEIQNAFDGFSATGNDQHLKDHDALVAIPQHSAVRDQDSMHPQDVFNDHVAAHEHGGIHQHETLGEQDAMHDDCHDHELYAVQEFNSTTKHQHCQEALDLIHLSRREAQENYPEAMQQSYEMQTHHEDSTQHDHESHDHRNTTQQMYETRHRASPHANVFGHEHMEETQDGAHEGSNMMDLSPVTALERVLGYDDLPAKL